MILENIDDSINEDSEHLAKMFTASDRIIIKKLSNNDRDWAERSNKHQTGVYIPHEVQDGGFFQPLQLKRRNADEGSEIREVFFRTVWP